MNLSLSEAGAAFIARFEGFEPKQYTCPAGKPTIGYGHVILQGESFGSLTKAEAQALLQTDAAKLAEPVARVLTVDLNQAQQDALISLIFNCGSGAIKKSTLLKKLNEGDFSGAADQFMVWNKVAKKTSKGLTRRRTAERMLFMTGDYGE